MTTSLEESYRWCQTLTRQSAGNFYYSFLSLPKEMFRDMCVLYAFMRVTDDLADRADATLEERRDSLLKWRDDLEAALQSAQPEPSTCAVSSHHVFPALSEIARRHDIPLEYFQTVIEGVTGDLEPRTFETFDELKDYCYQVAGVVGLCCIKIWGYDDPAAEEAAIDCGIAFQLTNILRDLAEDADQNRAYLPQDDLQQFGYGLADIHARTRDESFAALMAYESERAEGYFERSRQLVDLLEPVGQPIFAAMHAIYHELLAEIIRRDFDVYSQRVSVSRWKKVRLAIGACPRYRRLSALTRLVRP